MIERVAGSWRDPSGHVYEQDGRIFRTVSEYGRASYEAARDQNVLAHAIKRGFLLNCTELPQEAWPEGVANVAYVLEHPRIPYISFPYEWSFEQLQAAASLHLDFQLELLERNFKLTDASAYNIQFIGSKPVFIDVLSLAPYREGEYWLGHQQFCEQFLNPLLLRSTLGVTHNTWYRGSLEGISSTSLSNILPLHKCMSWKMFSHVTLPARLERQASAAPLAAIERVKSKKEKGSFSRLAYQGFLTQLRHWIVQLYPLDTGKTMWADYAQQNTYSDEGREAKHEFIQEFVSSTRPNVLMDLGCNTGDYSLAALKAGAGYVVGFDYDQHALSQAYSRSCEAELGRCFLPLWLDAANPSPDQGWRSAERPGFHARAKADALLALAFEHHLAIAKNVPLAQVVEWLVSLAPQGVIEFVPKKDETIQRMLALREDIFPDYHLAEFEAALTCHAKIVARQQVPGSNRVLLRYQV